MALNNPAFANPAFQEQRPGLTPPSAPAAQTQYATAQHQGVDVAAQANLEGMYAAPPAGAIETDRMTVEDTVMKTIGLFAILLATAVVGWIWTLSTVTVADPSPTMMPWIIGALGGLSLIHI